MLPTSPVERDPLAAEDRDRVRTAAGCYRQALAETDEARRRELIHEMQPLEYAYGGYIIPFYNDHVDAHSASVLGLRPNRGPLNLDAYGSGYRTMWFA